MMVCIDGTFAIAELLVWADGITHLLNQIRSFICSLGETICVH